MRRAIATAVDRAEGKTAPAKVLVEIPIRRGNIVATPAGITLPAPMEKAATQQDRPATQSKTCKALTERPVSDPCAMAADKLPLAAGARRRKVRRTGVMATAQNSEKGNIGDSGAKACRGPASTNPAAKGTAMLSNPANPATPRKAHTSATSGCKPTRNMNNTSPI